MNYTSRYVRLFPINFQLDDQEIDSILKEVNTISRCYYYWNSKFQHLDLLYTSKRPVDFFLNEEVLKNFHYWEIGADEGYYHDTIMGRSKIYNTLEKSFNYSSICYYQIDQIRFTGINDNFNNYISDLLYSPYGLQVNVKNNVYLRNEKIIYSATNDRWSTIDSLETNKNENLNNQLFNDGFILDMVSQYRFGEDRLNALQHVLKESKKKRNNCIKSIELINDGRTVHNFKWNEKLKKWTNLHGDFWSNCIDTEYIRFEEWYKNEKIVNTV